MTASSGKWYFEMTCSSSSGLYTVGLLDKPTNNESWYRNNGAYSSSFGGGAAGLKTKSNVVANTTFTGNPKKATVTFSAAFTDTNYGVTITGEDARSWTIESKIAGSFVINSNSNTGLSGNTFWHAIAYGETT
jgi:hypothetical protein